MRGFLLELSLDGPGLEFQYDISDCPVYPRTLYASFTVIQCIQSNISLFDGYDWFYKGRGICVCDDA